MTDHRSYIRNLSSFLPQFKYMNFHIFTFISSPQRVYNEFTDNDQLPVGLIAQLVEHCTGVAEVMGSNPVQA